MSARKFLLYAATVLGTAWCVLIAAAILPSNTRAADTEKPQAKKTPATAHAAAVIERMRQLSPQWPALVAEFQGEDIATWPPEAAALAGEAFQRRGEAYMRLKDGGKAEADLKMALKLSPRNALFWHTLADNYRDNLKDVAQALKAYDHAFDLTGPAQYWLPLAATVSAANILRDQGKYDEALKVMGRYKDLGAVVPTWRIKMLRAYAHIHAGQGKEEEALANFAEALRLETGKSQ
jgi:tetratricopeptide (TPR) repeat protein